MSGSDYRLAKNGDSQAFRQLFAQYQPIVFKMQKKYFLKDLEREDWQQEGRIVFYQSLQGFDAEKGLTLGYFFKLNFERHVFSLLRKQGALKRRAALLSVSYEGRLEKHGEQFICENKETYSFTQTICLQDQLSGFTADLSSLERQVFELYLANVDILVITKQLDCHENKVKNALERIKRKFKDRMK